MTTRFFTAESLMRQSISSDSASGAKRSRNSVNKSGMLSARISKRMKKRPLGASGPGGSACRLVSRIQPPCSAMKLATLATSPTRSGQEAVSV